jgi:putative restriction endonuclease
VKNNYDISDMDSIVLTKYLNAFSKLNRHSSKSIGIAPNKPILLLSILHEIEIGRVSENLIPITPELVSTFNAHWQALVPESSGRKAKISYPFRYLTSEGFWELIKNRQSVIIEAKSEPTLNQLVNMCDGGRFTDDLWTLLIDDQTRGILRNHLLSTYFSGQVVQITESATIDYLAIQAEKLKQQTQSKFKVKHINEDSDSYFVRSSLFPKVVKELYGFTCCVCNLSTVVDNNYLVDGAHIMPFAIFQNNDPRNGLSLCKNHHWGFDRGAWSLTDEYRVLVSSKLNNGINYIETGKIIILPSDMTYSPDPEALNWHRENIFRID